MSGKDKISVNPNIVLREEFDGQAFLYDPDTGDTFPLNASGAFIWRHLDGLHTIEEIIEMMVVDFDDVPDTANDQITAFIQDLWDKGFIAE